MDQQKDIAEIERKLAALSGDNSSSARAQRAKLEAELYEEQAELEETYYDRSIENQQSALDQSLESFQEEKDKEIEGWETYLDNIELVVSDSLEAVKANTGAILTSLQDMQTHYGLFITNELMKPWQAGETAIQSYGEKLNISLTTLAGLFGLTVDQFAAKLGITTEQLVAGLDITVAQVAENLGLTNEQMAAKLGLSLDQYNAMANGTIQALATSMGVTLPELANLLGTTTDGLVGNLDMTMIEFAGSLGLTVEELANKFGLSARDLADKLGTTYQDLTNPFGLSMSATVGALKALEMEYSKILAGIEKDSQSVVDDVNKAMDEYQKPQEDTKKEEPPKKQDQSNKQQTPARTDKDYYGVALAIWNGNYGWGTGITRVNNLKAKGFDANKVQDIVNQLGKDGYVHSGAWIGKYHGIKDLAPYHLNKFARGTTGAKKDQLAILDELGEELQLIPNGKGRLDYIKKGTGIIPADLTSNLMGWGQLDPQDMLDRNRPQIGASPSVVNTEISIDCSVGTMVHIEHCDQNTLPDVEKMVNKAFDKHMQTLNNAIRSKVR